jgi:hypothetical protein
LDVALKLVHDRCLAGNERPLKLDRWMSFNDDKHYPYLPFRPSRSSCIYVYRRRDVSTSVFATTSCNQFRKINAIMLKFPTKECMNLDVPSHYNDVAVVASTYSDLSAVVLQRLQAIEDVLRELTTRVTKIEETVSTRKLPVCMKVTDILLPDTEKCLCVMIPCFFVFVLIIPGTRWHKRRQRTCCY